MSRLAPLPLLGLLLGAAAPMPAETPVFETALEMVHVTVTARDARGRLVADLKREEFVLREGGEVQALQLFAPAFGPDGEAHDGRPEDFSEELSLQLGMLFDTSESMRNDLRLSQESAVRFLDNIPRAQDLLLVFFDRDIRLSRYDSENQQGIFERILESEVSGHTALFDSIAVYLSRVADTPGRKVLVVFSDGDDTTSRTSSQEVFALLRASDVVVYPVAFAGERPHTQAGLRAHAFLAELARESGGQVFRPQASRKLASIYQSILDELGSQYVLGFVPRNAARDGRYRRLSITVNRPGVKLRHRPGYTLPRDERPRASAR